MDAGDEWLARVHLNAMSVYVNEMRLNVGPQSA